MASFDTSSREYRVHREGFTFVLDEEGVRGVQALSDYEGRREPAVAEEFLRTRAEAWADALASANAEPGEYAVRVDEHQGKAHLWRGEVSVISVDL